ncbi:MAG: diaminopimelate decarboxylase [Chloroflexota bacterium]
MCQSDGFVFKILSVNYLEVSIINTNAFRLRPFEDGDYLKVKNRTLTFEGFDLARLANQYDTPLFVYSESRIRNNVRSLRSAFARYHSRSTVCFASKACANMSILKVVESEGLCLEVNSGGELAKAKQASFEPSRLIFNGVSKTHDEISLALDPPIKAINVDSQFELERIAQIAADRGVQARVALRGIPNVEGGSTSGNETGSTRSKFGMTEAEINECLAFCLAHSKEVAVVGLHVHIGSQMTDLSLYLAAASYLAEMAARIQQLFPTEFEHVNIGGGFPKNYVKYNDQSDAIGYFHSELDVEDVARAVVPLLINGLGQAIEILTEPGRAITSDAALCLCRVESIKQRENVTWLYLDTGYSVLPESGLGWYFHMVPVNRASEQETERFRVVGPLCDSFDVFFDMESESRIASLLAMEPSLVAYEETLRKVFVRVPGFRELPAATCPGDIVAILDTGAYQLEMASHYCGRFLPAACMIDVNGQVRLIRKRDTLEDLLYKET